MMRLIERELEDLTELSVSFYESVQVGIDPIVFRLSDGDISKYEAIINLDLQLCFNWYYLI